MNLDWKIGGSGMLFNGAKLFGELHQIGVDVIGLGDEQLRRSHQPEQPAAVAKIDTKVYVLFCCKLLWNRQLLATLTRHTLDIPASIGIGTNTPHFLSCSSSHTYLKPPYQEHQSHHDLSGAKIDVAAARHAIQPGWRTPPTCHDGQDVVVHRQSCHGGCGNIMQYDCLNLASST